MLSAKFKPLLAPVLFLLTAALFSFDNKTGGDSFSIFLNNQLLVQQYLYGDKAVKTVSLNSSNYQDELRISFSHCGQSGKSRNIVIRDDDKKILKQWRFDDTHKTMVCRVKDILHLKKGNTTLQLIYSSREIPNGLPLAFIKTGSAVKTAAP